MFIQKKGVSTKDVFKKGAFQKDEKGISKKKQIKRGDLRKMSEQSPFFKKAVIKLRVSKLSIFKLGALKEAFLKRCHKNKSLITMAFYSNCN